jgi:para-nitrobenzyl esterase
MIRTLLAAVATLALAPAVAQQAPAAEAPAAQTAAQTGAKFSTATSTIGQILDHPEAKAAFAKVLPEVAASPQLEQGRDFTIEAVAQMVPDYFPAEKVKQLNEELAKIK